MWCRYLFITGYDIPAAGRYVSRSCFQNPVVCCFFTASSSGIIPGPGYFWTDASKHSSHAHFIIKSLNLRAYNQWRFLCIFIVTTHRQSLSINGYDATAGHSHPVWSIRNILAHCLMDRKSVFICCNVFISPVTTGCGAPDQYFRAVKYNMLLPWRCSRGNSTRAQQILKLIDPNRAEQPSPRSSGDTGAAFYTEADFCGTAHIKAQHHCV